MEKLVYLIGSEVAPDELRAALTGPIGKRLLETGLFELEVHVQDQTGPLVERLENRMDPEGLMSACVSLWLPCLDDRAALEGALRAVAARLAGYSVTESVPREYASRSWPDGETSPTVTVGTALREKPGLDLETFYARWHGSHTPLSLRIHPLMRYVRNSVARVITPDAPPYRAIVFEAVESLEVLATPEIWYGSEAGRREAIGDLLAFADIDSMGSVAMSETIVRAAPWRAAPR
jgi:hypothetical protein